MCTNLSGYANSFWHIGEITLPALPVPRPKNFKHRLIQSAAAVFGLSESETEKLANKAGLSFGSAQNFNVHFREILEKSPKTHREIYEEAQVSERMFYLIRSRRIPSKTTLLALAIALNLPIGEIDFLLSQAGYVLSESVGFDMVVKQLITDTTGKTNRIHTINQILDELKLPLLMTRER